MNKITYLIIHNLGGTEYNPHQDTSNQSFDDVNSWHRDAKSPDGGHKYHYGQPSSLGYYLAYHYFIDKQGKVTQARADTEVGYHTIGYNDKSIGIVLSGNFDVYLPTWEQTTALKSLLMRKITQYGVKLENVVPHRAFASKSCWGANLADSWARDLVRPNVDQYVSLLGQLIFHLKLLLQKLQPVKLGVGGKECRGLSANQ